MHWEKGIFTNTEGSFGCCHHVIASTLVITDNEQKLSEDNIMYTEKFFGCVYHQKGDYVIVDLTNTLNNERTNSENDDNGED